MDKFVIVNGGTQKQRWLVEDITWWFCNKYFNRFKSFNIEIDLEKIEGEVQGWCMHIDGNVCHVSVDKRQKGDDFITCVLHELVHVKQHLKKELKEESLIHKKCGKAKKLFKSIIIIMTCLGKKRHMSYKRFY